MKFLVEIPDAKIEWQVRLNSTLHKVKFNERDTLKLLLEDSFSEVKVTKLSPDDRITCRPLIEI